MRTEVLSSRTCPCSAALARQLIQEQFAEDFAGAEQVDVRRVLDWLGSEEGIRATPHAQRSAAEIRVRLTPTFEMFPIVELIDEIENALGMTVTASTSEQSLTFSSFLTWMQEKSPDVFVVATANKIEMLPAEMLRKESPVAAFRRLRDEDVQPRFDPQLWQQFAELGWTAVWCAED